MSQGSNLCTTVPFRSQRVVVCCCGSHTAAALEIKTNPKHNILTKAGFQELLQMALAVRQHGKALLGPLFVFLSSNVHKRSPETAQGDTKNTKVLFSNILAVNTMIVMIILSCRGVYITVEQPVSSKLWDLWCWKKFESHFKLTRVFTHMKCFSHAMPKPTILKSTLPTIGSMKRIYSQVRESAFAKCGPIVWTDAWDGKGMPKPMQLRNQASAPSDFYHTSTNGKWVVGGKDLHTSAAYTVDFLQGYFGGLGDGHGENTGLVERCRSHFRP